MTAESIVLFPGILNARGEHVNVFMHYKYDTYLKLFYPYKLLTLSPKLFCMV